MRIPKKWDFIKVVRHIAGLLEKGWQVKRRKDRGIIFKPPESKRFCFCTLEALAHLHFIGPTIEPESGFHQAAIQLGINNQLEDAVVTANDSPVIVSMPGLNFIKRSQNRTLLLLSLGLPLDRGWQECVSYKFKRHVDRVLSRRQTQT